MAVNGHPYARTWRTVAGKIAGRPGIRHTGGAREYLDNLGLCTQPFMHGARSAERAHGVRQADRGERMTDEAKDWLHGTLDTLILQTLAGGARHGYGIARWIEEQSREAIRVEEGSLYPALYRMEKKGWLRAEWGTSELGRRAKFYGLTPAGRRRLKRDAAEWSRFAGGVARILGTEEAR